MKLKYSICCLRDVILKKEELYQAAYRILQYQELSLVRPLCKVFTNFYVPEFFISISGSDSWDGSSESHEDNTNVGPWKTLNHAIDQLRTLRPNPPTADSHATLVLLPGTHYITSKISMNQRDSHIIIKSLNGAEVAISGRYYIDYPYNR